MDHYVLQNHGENHYTAGLHFDRIGFDQERKFVVICVK